MQEAHINKYTNGSNNEIDLRELFFILFRGKWIIVSVTGFLSIIGLLYSLLLPNIYESKAILVPVNSSNGISGAFQNYSGLAGIAGITLPSNNDEGNSAKAIRKMSSLSFFENNILPNIYLPDLMAVKFWNSDTKKIDYDKSIYNIQTKNWIRDYSYPNKQIPSAQESFQVFLSNHLNLSEDKKSGFITLSIKHQSPYVAEQWARLIINEVNEFYREKDKSESQRAAAYLNQQISITSLSEIKFVFTQLLQEEFKKLTLIEANQSYVFDYIDPPAVMEKKSEPKRVLICIISALLGVLLSIVLVFIKHFATKDQEVEA
tara:strand:- start:530 stop:1483 length:954 start_codon:yes stop_codon:yes gene_type:complete